MAQKAQSGNTLVLSTRTKTAMRQLADKHRELAEQTGQDWFYGLYQGERRMKARVGRNQGGYYWQIDVSERRYFKSSDPLINGLKDRKLDKFGYITMPYEGRMSKSTEQVRFGVHEKMEIDDVKDGKRLNPFGVPEERVRQAA